MVKAECVNPHTPEPMNMRKTPSHAAPTLIVSGDNVTCKSAQISKAVNQPHVNPPDIRRCLVALRVAGGGTKPSKGDTTPPKPHSVMIGHIFRGVK